MRPRYARPNVDAFRHVAEAYGDDNPLWSDEDYAARTVWGGVVAPPPLVGGDSLIGFDEVTRVPEEHRELMKGDPLRGCMHSILRAHVNGGLHCVPIVESADEMRSLASSRSPVSSLAVPFTSGWHRCSVKTTDRHFRRSIA